ARPFPPGSRMLRNLRRGCKLNLRRTGNSGAGGGGTPVTDWGPATDPEAALNEALRTGDQELYFRILARTDLLLPVADDSPGRGSAGWGTWTTGGRTHVLAFTSVDAMRICLAEHAGSARRVPYHDLAAAWP